MKRAAAAIEKIEAKAYKAPTDRPESDGTIEYDATTRRRGYRDLPLRRGIQELSPAGGG